MPLFLNLLLSLGFAAGVGAAVHLWRAHLDTARRDGMQALAARRGWALTVTDERLGRPGTLRLVPRGGLPWIAEARPHHAPGGPLTAYEAEAPRWTEGTLVLAAREAAVDATRLRELVGDVVRTRETLKVVPVGDGFLALSDGEPSLRVDLAVLTQVLGDWVPVVPGARGRPVLVLSREGLRLSLRQPLRRPEQMERFLDLALELSRLIGPSR